MSPSLPSKSIWRIVQEPIPKSAAPELVDQFYKQDQEIRLRGLRVVGLISATLTLLLTLTHLTTKVEPLWLILLIDGIALTGAIPVIFYHYIKQKFSAYAVIYVFIAFLYLSNGIWSVSFQEIDNTLTIALIITFFTSSVIWPRKWILLTYATSVATFVTVWMLIPRTPAQTASQHLYPLIIYLGSIALSWFIHNTVTHQQWGVFVSQFRIEDLNRELTQQKEALQETNNQLALYNEELVAFAHMVAHDLKNPLAVISGLLELYLDDPETIDEEFLMGKVVEMSQKSVQIVESLLLLAEVRQAKVAFEVIPMADVVEQAYGRLEYLIADFEAQVEMPETWPLVKGESVWIEEVWVNYMSNALKYGGQPPHLTLGYTDEGEYLKFWVQDKGPGLDEEQQAQLFVPFTRLKNTHGHGLGLAIVQQIVENLGGSVGVESVLGEGSCFYFTLPKINQGLGQTAPPVLGYTQTVPQLP